MVGLPAATNLDYVARVNRVIDHLYARLDQPLPLEEAARVACFSPFHFHRIFKALVGESLNTFVKRVRLERALGLLSHREASLTDVALATGFASSSDFSRSFRKHFGVPPSAFDVEAYRRGQRERMQDHLTTTAEDRQRLARLPDGENPDGFAVRLRSVGPRRVAYARVWRPFEAGKVTTAAAELVAWAQARGLAEGQWLGYMWDDPEIVALDQCRYDVGVEVPAGTWFAGEVGFVDFPAMTLAEVAIAGSIDLEMRALDWLYRTWLPSSGWVPDHQPCFEAWKGLPFASGEGSFALAVQLAVVDAQAPL
jgi:AraC family transcriptional regulator